MKHGYNENLKKIAKLSEEAGFANPSRYSISTPIIRAPLTRQNSHSRTNMMYLNVLIQPTVVLLISTKTKILRR
jgi:hypothetical protein